MSPLSAPSRGFRSSRLRASRFCATSPSSRRSSSRWADAQAAADDAEDRAHDHAQDGQRHQRLEQREAGARRARGGDRSWRRRHGDAAGEPVHVHRPAGRRRPPARRGRRSRCRWGRTAGRPRRTRPRPARCRAGSRGAIAAAVTAASRARCAWRRCAGRGSPAPPCGVVRSMSGRSSVRTCGSATPASSATIVEHHQQLDQREAAVSCPSS